MKLPNYIIIVVCLFIVSINIIYGEHYKNIEGYNSIISFTKNGEPLFKQRYDSKKTDFDTNNYDVVYHDTPESIFIQNGIPSVVPKTINVIDKTGKGIIELPFYGEDNVLPIYGKLNSFKYGSSSNYVPDYTGSIYMGLYSS